MTAGSSGWDCCACPACAVLMRPANRSMYNNTNAVLLFLPLILLKGELAVVLTAPVRCPPRCLQRRPPHLADADPRAAGVHDHVLDRHDGHWRVWLPDRHCHLLANPAHQPADAQHLRHRQGVRAGALRAACAGRHLPSLLTLPQSALSVPLFGSKITAMGAAGIGLVVLGTFQYTQVRRAEMEAASSAAAAPRAVTLSPQRRSSSAV